MSNKETAEKNVLNLPVRATAPCAGSTAHIRGWNWCWT